MGLRSGEELTDRDGSVQKGIVHTIYLHFFGQAKLYIINRKKKKKKTKIKLSKETLKRLGMCNYS